MTHAIFLALSVFGLSAPAQAADSTLVKKPCYDMSAVACEVFHRTNEQRKKNRLPALNYSKRCYAMAQEQSEDMASRDYFDHNRPTSRKQRGETFSERAKRFGLPWAGENIANTQGGAAQAVTMWMNSPGHRRNILNRDYTSFAVGFRDGLYTQVFTKDSGRDAVVQLQDEELPAETTDSSY